MGVPVVSSPSDSGRFLESSQRQQRLSPGGGRLTRRRLSSIEAFPCDVDEASRGYARAVDRKLKDNRAVWEQRKGGVFDEAARETKYKRVGSIVASYLPGKKFWQFVKNSFKSAPKRVGFSSDIASDGEVLSDRLSDYSPDFRSVDEDKGLFPDDVTTWHDQVSDSYDRLLSMVRDVCCDARGEVIRAEDSAAVERLQNLRKEAEEAATDVDSQSAAIVRHMVVSGLNELCAPSLPISEQGEFGSQDCQENQDGIDWKGFTDLVTLFRDHCLVVSKEEDVVLLRQLENILTECAGAGSAAQRSRVMGIVHEYVGGCCDLSGVHAERDQNQEELTLHLGKISFSLNTKYLQEVRKLEDKNIAFFSLLEVLTLGRKGLHLEIFGIERKLRLGYKAAYAFDRLNRISSGIVSVVGRTSPFLSASNGLNGSSVGFSTVTFAVSWLGVLDATVSTYKLAGELSKVSSALDEVQSAEKKDAELEQIGKTIVKAKTYLFKNRLCYLSTQLVGALSATVSLFAAVVGLAAIVTGIGLLAISGWGLLIAAGIVAVASVVACVVYYGVVFYRWHSRRKRVRMMQGVVQGDGKAIRKYRQKHKELLTKTEEEVKKAAANELVNFSAKCALYMLVERFRTETTDIPPSSPSYHELPTYRFLSSFVGHEGIVGLGGMSTPEAVAFLSAKLRVAE